MTDNNQLKSFVERVENVEAEIRDRQEDRKAIYQEMKSAGFDQRIVRKLVSVRRKKAQAVAEENELLRVYAESLGMQQDFGF